MSVRPKLLYVLHAAFNLGGTEEHTRTLATFLGEQFEIYIAAPERNELLLLKDGKPVRSWPWAKVPNLVTPLHSLEHEAAFSELLRVVGPDLVHVQHFINYPLFCLELISQLGVPVVYSFHDYAALTPHFTMQGVTDPLIVTTPAHSIETFGQDISSYLIARQKFLQEQVSKAARVIVPSQYLAEVLRSSLGFTCQIIPHGIRPFEAEPFVPSPQIRIGYTGGFLPQKGIDVLLVAFMKLHEQLANTELHIWGPTGMQGLNLPPFIRFYGPYGPDERRRIFSKLDIGVIPSLFAETFSLVLSEMRSVGIPVAASRIGALTERIEGTRDTLCTPGDPASLMQALFSLAQPLAPRIPQPQRLAHEMCVDYAKLYLQLLGHIR